MLSSWRSRPPVALRYESPPLPADNRPRTGVSEGEQQATVSRDVKEVRVAYGMLERR